MSSWGVPARGLLILAYLCACSGDGESTDASTDAPSSDTRLADSNARDSNTRDSNAGDSNTGDSDRRDSTVGDSAVLDSTLDTGISDSDPADAPELLGAPYPIVLAHGFFGFEELGGSERATYFYRVRETLLEAGEAEVFTPEVDPFNSSTVRGEALLLAVQAIVEETGRAKVNLIGHSQGGLDARYVASVRPDLVASVTTVATPHRGTPLVDLVRRAGESVLLREFVDGFARLVGAPLFDSLGEETSVFAALEQLSESGAAEFNEAHPNADGVRYWSIGGRSGLVLARDDCAADVEAPTFIADFERSRDPVDPLLSTSEAIFDGGFGEPFPNDGLVRVESSRWGTFLGCIPADHIDQVGHLFGDSPGLGNRWRHLPFYRDLVAFLRTEEL